MSPINIPINMDDANEGASNFLETFNSIISATNNEAEDMRLITKELSSSVEQANNLLSLGKDFRDVISDSKSLVEQLAISLQTAAQGATAPIKNLLQLINEAQRGLSALGGTPSDFAGFARQFGGPRAPQDVTASPDFSDDSDSRAYQPRPEPSSGQQRQQRRRRRTSDPLLDDLLNIESIENESIESIEDTMKNGRTKLPDYGNTDIVRNPPEYEPPRDPRVEKNVQRYEDRQLLRKFFPNVEPYISNEQLGNGRIASVAYQESMNRLAAAASLFGRRGRKAFRYARNIANLTGYNLRGIRADERADWVMDENYMEYLDPAWQYENDPTKQTPILRFANKLLGGLDSLLGRKPGQRIPNVVNPNQMQSDLGDSAPPNAAEQAAAAGGSSGAGGGGGGFINSVVQGEWDHIPGMGGNMGDMLGKLGQVKDILSNPIVSAGLVLTAGVYGYKGLYQLAESARGITKYAQKMGNAYGTVDYSRTLSDTVGDFARSGFGLNPFYSFKNVQEARLYGASVVGFKGSSLNNFIDTAMQMQESYGINSQQFSQYYNAAASFGMNLNDYVNMFGAERNITAGSYMTTSYADQAALTGAGTFAGLGVSSSTSSILGALGVTYGVDNKVIQSMGATGYELMGTMYGQAMMAQALGTDINNLSGALQKSNATQIADLNNDMIINILINLGIPIDDIKGSSDPRLLTLTLLVTFQALGIKSIKTRQDAANYAWKAIQNHKHKKAFNFNALATSNKFNYKYQHELVHGAKVWTGKTFGYTDAHMGSSQLHTQQEVIQQGITQAVLNSSDKMYKTDAGVEGADTVWNRARAQEISSLYAQYAQAEKWAGAAHRGGMSEQQFLDKSHIKISIEGTQFATLRAAMQSTYKSYTNGDIPPSHQPLRGG
jgi:hypothetical protein